MSIYNAIANHGQNVGAGLNAFVQGKYQVAQGQRANALEDENRTYTKSRNALADQRYNDQDLESFKSETMERAIEMARGGLGQQEVLGYLDREGRGRGLPGVDPAVWQEIEARAKGGQGPQGAPKREKRMLPDGTEIVEEWDGGQWQQVGDPAPPRAGQTINVNTADASQSALQDALVKDQAANFTEMQDRGRKAQSILSQLSVARNINVETNPGQSYKLIARQVGSVLGLPVDDLEIANAQSFQAVMGRLVNERVSQEKGPQTDEDVRRFARTMASIDNGPAAKDFLLGYAEALAMRDVEQAKFFREGARQQRDYEEMNDEWNAYLGKTPMIRTDLADPTTSLPVFYYQFVRMMKQANPGISDDDILKEWRSGSR